MLSFGGVGKTRLAIEVAANLADRFVDGVWFVDLVPITDAMLAPDTFIAGVGLPATGNRDPAAYSLSQLATRDSLIVVDNCEHLVDDVGDLVGRLVRAAPHVRVLTTSRLSLGVRDEVIWHVQPLAVALRRSSCSHSELGSFGPGSWSTTRIAAGSNRSANASTASRWRSNSPAHDSRQ